MAITETKQRRQLEELLEKMQKAHDRSGELLEEGRRILAGEQSQGEIIKGLFESWSEVWTHRYRTKYIYGNHLAAVANWKRLLKMLEPAEIVGRMLEYLQSNDPYYVNARHPLEMFVKAINKFGRVTSDADNFLTSQPIGCRHRPACKTDVACTQRTQRELRQQPEPPL